VSANPLNRQAVRWAARSVARPSHWQGRQVRGAALALAALPADELLTFKTIANFSHNFLQPFAITFDYMDMNLYIAGESLKSGG
jgi:hypothetical protein